jgi:hypothetical protein
MSRSEQDTCREEVAMPLNEAPRMTQRNAGDSTRADREKADGMLRHTRLPNEPREYLQKREELRLAEMEMFRNIERVAALRKALPLGAEVTDYVFQQGPATSMVRIARSALCA